MPDCQPMQGHWVSRKVFSQHQEIVSHVTLGDNIGKLQDTAQSAAPTFTAYSTSPWCPPPPDSVGVSHCKTGCIRYAAQLMFWLGHWGYSGQSYWSTLVWTSLHSYTRLCKMSCCNFDHMSLKHVEVPRPQQVMPKYRQKSYSMTKTEMEKYFKKILLRVVSFWYFNHQINLANRQSS